DRQRADVESDELIGPKAAAEVLGCDVRTLRRWKHEGRLPPPLLLGRSPKWRRAEIAALVHREGAA
ncbi:MAG: MerR family transcriptional regulator, partial [Planctomycetes bacterium]|nr:MerR family transcriptional regulator [Planctomycetota bacterium]